VTEPGFDRVSPEHSPGLDPVPDQGDADTDHDHAWTRVRGDGDDPVGDAYECEICASNWSI
jgi:hypothetical protein